MSKPTREKGKTAALAEVSLILAAAWAALCYSAVLATAFAFTAWQKGISRIGANRVLVYQYLITQTGVASGIVFFNEHLGPSKLVGDAVILFGAYLARRQLEPGRARKDPLRPRPSTSNPRPQGFPGCIARAVEIVPW